MEAVCAKYVSSRCLFVFDNIASKAIATAVSVFAQVVLERCERVGVLATTGNASDMEPLATVTAPSAMKTTAASVATSVKAKAPRSKLWGRATCTVGMLTLLDLARLFTIHTPRAVSLPMCSLNGEEFNYDFAAKRLDKTAFVEVPYLHHPFSRLVC